MAGIVNPQQGTPAPGLPAVNPQMLQQLIADALGAKFQPSAPAGPGQPMPIGVSRNAPGKQAAEVAPAGRRFQPGIGSDAVAGGTASMQGGNVVQPTAPVQGPPVPGQDGTMPNMLPPGGGAGAGTDAAAGGNAGGDQLADPNAATPNGPVQGGVMNALGLSSLTPYVNSVGAGMAAASNATNFSQALAQGFGGASAYYDKKDELEKQRAIAQAEKDREEEWRKRNFELSTSKEQFDRQHTMTQEQLQRDTLDATVQNRDTETHRKEDDDYTKAVEDARQEADAKVTTTMGTDATMSQPGEREAARDEALKKARQSRGLSYGTGMSQDDPFVPSTNDRHASIELENEKKAAIAAQQPGHIVRLPNGKLARFDPSIMQWRPVAKSEKK